MYNMVPEMNPIIFLLIGLVLGIAGTLVIVIITGFGAGKKAEKTINEAKKEAEKLRRDSLADLKEESFKLKQTVPNSSLNFLTILNLLSFMPLTSL